MDTSRVPAAPFAACVRALASAWLLALAPPVAFASDAKEPERPAPASGASWRDGLRLSLAAEGTPEVDFGDADVSWVRTTGRVSLQGPVSDRWGLGASFSAELLSSDVEDEPSFLAAAADGDGPLRDLFESTLSVGARFRIGERWAVGSDPYLTAKLETGAALGDSLKGGAVLTLAYRRSDAFDLSAGVKLGSRFDRPGLFAWPVLHVAWRITPRLEFEIRNANIRLGYEVWRGLELLGFGSFSSDRYRLERRTAGPLANDAGTLGFRGATLGVGFRWNATEQLRVVGSVGVAVWQRLLVNDASDNRVASRDMRGVAPVITLRVQTRF